MANDYFNKQIRNVKEPTSGVGVKPLPAGKSSTSLPERTASWPGLPGKSQKDRSSGTPKCKTYPKSEGL